MFVLALATQWVGLLGALGGVLITGCIGLATAWLNHRWQRESAFDERAHQQREARASLQREAYSRYLAAYEAFENHVTTVDLDDVETEDIWPKLHKKNPAVVDEFYAAANHARLLAGDGVLAAIEAFDEAWEGAVFGDADEDVIAEQKKELIKAMRVEQNRPLVS